MTQHDPRELRNAFGTFMTGVTVVTAKGSDGAPMGFTANSFTSVSLDPPLVLVCLANTSRNFTAFTQADGFAVNILSETQGTFRTPLPARPRIALRMWTGTKGRMAGLSSTVRRRGSIVRCTRPSMRGTMSS